MIPDPPAREDPAHLVRLFKQTERKSRRTPGDQLAIACQILNLATNGLVVSRGCTGITFEFEGYRTHVVVTHHAPSIHSLPPDRMQDPVSCAYASHLDGLIQRTRPLLWIHGHIHHSQDYSIGETRIIANPRGYADSPNDDFNPELVIEL